MSSNKPKVVLFVGDAPARGCESDEAFSERSASGRKLRGWIGAAGFWTKNLFTGEPHWNVRFINRSEGGDKLEDAIMSADLVVCCGFNAWSEIEGLEECGLNPKAIRIPHPSGKNRQLNDPSVEETIVKTLWDLREKIDGIHFVEGKKIDF